MKFLSVLTYLALMSSIFVYAANGSLEEICKKVSHGNTTIYELCVTSLQVVPGSRTADLASLTVMAAELTKTNYTYALAQYCELRNKSEGLSNNTKQCIDVCVDIYSQNGADKGLIHAKAKDYDNLARDMFYVHELVRTCKETFAEGGVPPMLPKVDADVNIISYLTYALANLFLSN